MVTNESVKQEKIDIENFCEHLGEQYQPNRTRCTYHCNLPDNQTECPKIESKHFPIKVIGLKLCNIEMINEVYIHMPDKIMAQKELKKMLKENPKSD
jgi:hypothetical protein